MPPGSGGRIGVDRDEDTYLDGDERDAGSDPGDPASVPGAGIAFLRGNCNGDESLDISDPIFLLLYLFSGGKAPDCELACDSNSDGVLNIADPSHTLNYLFASGPPPGEVPRCETAEAAACSKEVCPN